jgi:hypothetical protein
MNNNNGPSEVQVLRQMLINDQKPTRTMLTKEGNPNKQVAAEGCIVPTNALNGKAPIVLTDAGKELFAIWKSCTDAELNRKLDKTLMLKLEAKIVATVDARKKAEKQLTKDETAEFGFKKLSKSKPCHNCETNTLKSYNFGDKSRKAIPFCHRKDCVEARNEYAADLADAAPAAAPKNTKKKNLFAAPAAAAPAPAWTPSRKLTDLTNDELMAVMIDLVNYPKAAREMAAKIHEEREKAAQPKPRTPESVLGMEDSDQDDDEEDERPVPAPKRAAVAPKGKGKGGNKRK